jgi:hypothetical protein
VYNLLALCDEHLAEVLVTFRSAIRHGRFWPYSITSKYKLFGLGNEHAG